MKRICIYCGSSDKIPQVYLDAAYEMGRTVAQNDITLIYGAGKTGMMGAVADGAIEAGGKVWGVIPKIFDTPQLAHKSLTHYEVTDNMHTRKARMADLADGFIALPGGFGTFDELFETLTWGQVGEHQKPVGLLNVNNYYAALLATLKHAVGEGFIFQEHLDALACETDPEKLLNVMGDYQHPHDAVKKWMRED